MYLNNPKLINTHLLLKYYMEKEEKCYSYISRMRAVIISDQACDLSPRTPNTTTGLIVNEFVNALRGRVTPRDAIIKDTTRTWPVRGVQFTFISSEMRKLEKG